MLDPVTVSTLTRLDDQRRFAELERRLARRSAIEAPRATSRSARRHMHPAGAPRPAVCDTPC